MRISFVNAVTDSLTGLFARDELSRLFDGLSKRDGASFFLLDIDHFKLINDCNGHGRGDEVLVALARFLKKRAKDGCIFRMGGDEFLMMLPGHGKRASQQFAQRLNRELAEEVFRGKPDLSITLSMGISFFPGDGKTMRDVLRCADERLYHAKRNGRNQFCITHPPEQEHPILHDPVRLIGREKTFLSIKELLDSALEGNMKVMVVSGERGVGKTFLCSKFLEYAEMRGGLVRRVSLGDISCERSLIGEITEGIFPNRREMKRYLRDERVEYRDELALLLDRGEGGRHIEEYRMQRGLITLLDMCALQAGSLVVFVDNFENGAQHAIRLLDSLARAKNSMAMLLLIGIECDTLLTCEELCSRYKTREAVKTAVLQPFSKKDHRTLVKTLLGSAKLSNTLFEFAYERAEGNPLLTREVLFAAIEQQIITREENEWVICGRNGTVGLSRSIHLFLEHKLRSLRKEENELLQYASIFGKTFESAYLARMMRMDEGAVAGLLRAPIVLGVVDDEGNGRFSFRLMYRDTFYERIPDTEKALLHKRIGKLLERCTTEEHKRRSYHHFIRAGEDASARRVAVTLFKNAMSKGGYKEAKQYVDFILSRKIAENAQLYALLLLAAHCYAMNGMHERAIELYRKVAASAPSRKNQGLLAIARLYRKQGKPSRALDELLAIHTKSPVLLCNTLHEIAETLLHMGRLEKAEEYVRRALLLSKRWGKKQQEADGYYTIAGVFWYRGEYELAEDFLNKALQIYKKLGREKEVALTMNRLGIVNWSCGSLNEAVALIENAVERFKREAGMEEEYRAYTNLGILHEAMGQWKEAHAYYGKSLDMALFLNVVPLACRNYNNIGTLLLKEGRFEDALRLLKKALSLRGKNGDRIELASSYHNLGVAYLYQGVYGKAAYFLARARTIFEDEGALGMLISNLNAFFELYIYERQHKKAGEMKVRISALIDTNGTELQRAQFFRVLARFHRLQGERNKSRRYARHSIELLGAPYELYEKGKALFELGLVLLEDGSRSEAKRVLRRARAAFKQLGAKKALERVERIMVQRGVGTWERRRRGEKR